MATVNVSHVELNDLEIEIENDDVASALAEMTGDDLKEVMLQALDMSSYPDAAIEAVQTAITEYRLAKQ